MREKWGKKERKKNRKKERTKNSKSKWKRRKEIVVEEDVVIK